jgi:outer membrane protein assembly factor BamB
MNRLFSLTAVTTLFFALLLAGCSGGAGPITPPDSSGQGDGSALDIMAPSSPLPADTTSQETGPRLTEQSQPPSMRSDRMLFGIWDITFDPVEDNIVIVPDRSLEMHVNVAPMVLPPKCTDCLKIKVKGINQTTHVYTFDITLKNPTLALTGYDVRGTLMFPPGDNRELVNADDYTKILDDSNPKDINPFIAYAKTVPLRAFGPGLSHTSQFDIKFPPPANLNVLFVVDASWPANQEEPYLIDNVYLDGGINECISKEGWLYAHVFDWQGNIADVTLDLSPIGGSVVSMAYVSSNTYRYYLNNYDYGAAVGTYKCLITATSEDTEWALYDYYTLVVEACTNTPPQWDTTVGVTDVNPVTGGLEIEYGTATDTDTPVTFNIYYSEDYPIEWTTADKVNDADGSPYILSGLSDAITYYVGVRAKDALGNEEKNTEQMTGVPSNPPVWDTTVGITAAIAQDQAVQVEYGTASDPQTPVTYNVYWSETTPIDFGTADFINDTASPTIVPSLDNFKTYHFAVRAIDGVGAEDTNTNELSAIPNGPPEWVGPVGIQSTAPGDTSVTVTYGTATDIDLPIVYNVYYSETSPIDFGTADFETDVNGSPYTVNGLVNGTTYHFAVRAEDSGSNEEQNTVELPGTPDSAPTWENDLIGVQSLIPFDHEVTVFYGHAIDDDPPITYYVYYSKTTPINFATASFVTTTAESPKVVTGLDNLVPYYFAVRAKDGLGIMDQNTVTLSTIPNPAPQWSTTVGIQTLEPQNETLIAYYGVATDIDIPVTYHVYYTENASVNFATDPYIDDPGGSPTPITGLINGQTYAVAVRAADSYGHEDQNTVVKHGVPYNLPNNTWTIFTGGVVQSSPSLADLNGDDVLDVIIGDQANKMAAYSGVNGGQIWSFPTAGWVDSSPALADEGGNSTLDVIFGSLDKKVYCVNGATGGELWHHDVGGGVISSPALANVVGDFHLDVIIGCMDGYVYALNGVSGAQHWAFPTGAGVFSSPAVADLNDDEIPDAVVGSRDGNVYAIDGNAGTQLWNFPTYEWINSSPALVDLNGDTVPDVVIASLDGDVYALDGTDGGEIWSFPTGAYIWTSPAIAELDGDSVPDVVLGTDNSNLYAISGDDGSQIWAFPSNDRIWSSAALADVNDDSIPDAVVGSDDGYLYAINGDTGGLLWAYPTGDWVDSSPAVGDIDDDGVMDFAFGRYDGYVTVLTSNDAPLSVMPWPMFHRNLLHTGLY